MHQVVLPNSWLETHLLLLANIADYGVYTKHVGGGAEAFTNFSKIIL